MSMNTTHDTSFDGFAPDSPALSVHTRKKHGIQMLGCGAAALVVGVLFAACVKDHDIGIMCVLGGPLLVVAACMGTAGLSRLDDFVEVREGGLLTGHRNRELDIPWSTILSVRQEIVVHRTHFVKTHTTKIMTLRLTDGRKATFDGSYADFDSLLAAVQQAVTPLRLADARDVIESGGSADFGAITVSPQAIKIFRKTIPWENVQRIVFEKGLMYIKRKDRLLTGVPCQVSRIENLFACLAVIEDYVHVERARAGKFMV